MQGAWEASLSSFQHSAEDARSWLSQPDDTSMGSPPLLQRHAQVAADADARGVTDSSKDCSKDAGMHESMPLQSIREASSGEASSPDAQTADPPRQADMITNGSMSPIESSMTQQNEPHASRGESSLGQRFAKGPKHEQQLFSRGESHNHIAAEPHASMDATSGSHMADTKYTHPQSGRTDSSRQRKELNEGPEHRVLLHRVLVQSLVSAAAACKQLGRLQRAREYLMQAAELEPTVRKAHLEPLEYEMSRSHLR